MKNNAKDKTSCDVIQYDTEGHLAVPEPRPELNPLRNLIAKIDSQPDFSEMQFNRAVKELVCITASYRETYFYQAAYGQTRSAKILIKAIQDPALEGIVPLGAIIFNTTDIDYTTQSDAEIIRALENLRTGQRWQQSASRLNMVGAL